jgi:cell division protein FtsZ
MQGATAAPLVERSIRRATGIVYTVTGGADVTLADLQQVSEVIEEMAAPECNIIFGTVTDDSLQGQLHVSVIATGFESDLGEGFLEANEAILSAAHAEEARPMRMNPFQRHLGLGF